MNTHLSAAQVAAQIGCSQRTITRISATHLIGQPVGRIRVYSAADAARLAKLVRPGPGNPQFVPGNDFASRGGRKAAKNRLKTAEKRHS